MPEELGTAYQCNECNGILIGNSETADSHEQIPFGPVPVRGFVFRKIFKGIEEHFPSYGIILKSVGKESNNSIFLEDPTHPGNHSYLYDSLLLYQTESRLNEADTEHDRNYKSLIRRLQNGDAKPLDNTEFANFLKMFPEMRESRRYELKPEDLIQKVDHIEQILTQPAK